MNEVSPATIEGLQTLFESSHPLSQETLGKLYDLRVALIENAVPDTPPDKGGAPTGGFVTTSLPLNAVVTCTTFHIDDNNQVLLMGMRSVKGVHAIRIQAISKTEVILREEDVKAFLSSPDGKRAPMVEKYTGATKDHYEYAAGKAKEGSTGRVKSTSTFKPLFDHRPPGHQNRSAS
jgi:hypothetical protein